MPLYDCPVCGTMHRINSYESGSVTCPNSLRQKKKTLMIKEDLYTRAWWNFNEKSTRFRGYRDAEVMPKKLKSDRNRKNGGLRNYNW